MTDQTLEFVCTYPMTPGGNYLTKYVVRVEPIKVADYLLTVKMHGQITRQTTYADYDEAKAEYFALINSFTRNWRY